MLVVAVVEECVAGEVRLLGWLCKQQSSLLCTFQQVQEQFFPPVIRSKPSSPSGRQDLCAAVVLDSFLRAYMVRLHPLSCC